MEKHQQTWEKLGRAFCSIWSCIHVVHLLCYEAKLTDLKLRTWYKQLLSLPLFDITMTASFKNNASLDGSELVLSKSDK